MSDELEGAPPQEGGAPIEESAQESDQANLAAPEADLPQDAAPEMSAADEEQIEERAEEEQAEAVMASEGDSSKPAPAVSAPAPAVNPRKAEDFSRDGDEVPDFSQVPTVEGEHEDGRAWYVVHCYSGYENKVRHNLEQRIESMGMKNLIFDVVVPTEEEIEVKEGKRRTVERRVFPGYILVNMVLSEESWYVVRNTPGVTSFVGQGNTPLPLRPEEVSQIVKRMEAEAPRIKVTFKQGERVRIVDGPFNDFRGTVSEIDMERAKVRVMVNFFGRETPVELDFLQVEKS
jgi:transcriptional antiterminator NusG